MIDPIPAWQIQDAAIKARLQGSTMGVLFALLNFRQAGAFETWPSVGALAERTGYCERQVRRALRTLEASGWVTRSHDPVMQITPHYTLLIPAMSSPSEMSGGGGHHHVRGGRTSSCPPNTPLDTPRNEHTPQTPQGGLVDEPQSEPSPTPENVVTYRRPGPLSPDPEQRAASYEAVNETPQSRGSRNLAAHEGPPTPPPPYRYKGVDLPGRISDLLPREVAAALAVHFKGDRYRSGTQKLFEAKSLDYMRGLTSIAVEDIAIHMDIHWRVRPPALKDLAVPYVAGGEDVRWDAERLYHYLGGRLIPNADLQQLIPDSTKRRPILDLLRELGAESVPAGWAELGRQIREAQAKAVNQ